MHDSIFSVGAAIHPPAPRDAHHEQYDKAGIEASTSSLRALCTVDSVAVVVGVVLVVGAVAAVVVSKMAAEPAADAFFSRTRRVLAAEDASVFPLD